MRGTVWCEVARAGLTLSSTKSCESTRLVFVSLSPAAVGPICKADHYAAVMHLVRQRQNQVDNSISIARTDAPCLLLRTIHFTLSGKSSSANNIDLINNLFSVALFFVQVQAPLYSL